MSTREGQAAERACGAEHHESTVSAAEREIDDERGLPDQLIDRAQEAQHKPESGESSRTGKQNVALGGCGCVGAAAL
jgi:hypothetical protein